MSNIAVIGLGEAGSTYAVALASAGHHVCGIDPAPVPTPVGVERVETIVGLPLDYVLVVTSARVAEVLSETVLPSLAGDIVWIDMTTASPMQKAKVAERDDVHRHVDVAILGPVISLGIATPLMAAGAQARAVVSLLSSAGAPIESVPAGSPGDAMSHKLLRSVFMKGIAAVVIEAVTAGTAAGRESWVREQIAGVLAGDGQAVIDRFVTGTRKHAVRRADEMASVIDYLGELGAPSELSLGTRAQLSRLSSER